MLLSSSPSVFGTFAAATLAIVLLATISIPILAAAQSSTEQQASPSSTSAATTSTSSSPSSSSSSSSPSSSPFAASPTPPSAANSSSSSSPSTISSSSQQSSALATELATTVTAATATGGLPTAQLPLPPSADDDSAVVGGINVSTSPMMTTTAETAGAGKPKVVVARQSPSGAASPPSVAQSADASGGAEGGGPFSALKPESKDEMFTRIDSDGDNAVTLQDYMNRDRYYVESVKTEFNDIDTNRDGRVTKAEFDAFVQRLDEQRRAAMMGASNFTLQKNDMNKDSELSVDELGQYINGTLGRNTARLPEVFRQHDRDNNNQLNLDEFHELDFNFPWEKFPPNGVPLQQQQPNGQVFFNANGAIPPPFMNEQTAAAPFPAPPQGAYGSAPPGGAIPLPAPQPVVRRFFRRHWAPI